MSLDNKMNTLANTSSGKLEHIETSKDGLIHTSNGTHIQIRSKDSKPYHPIYSHKYGRYVSNKNHAFYFQKQFVYDVRK